MVIVDKWHSAVGEEVGLGVERDVEVVVFKRGVHLRGGWRHAEHGGVVDKCGVHAWQTSKCALYRMHRSHSKVLARDHHVRASFGRPAHRLQPNHRDADIAILARAINDLAELVQARRVHLVFVTG